MQKIGDHKVQIVFTNEEFERIQQIAKRHNLKYAQVVRNISKVGLELYEDLEIVGAVKALEIYEKGSEKIKRMKSARQMKLV